MQIIWHGQSCFQIASSQGKNSQVNIIIDPFDETIGLRVPKLEADILLITHSHHDHNNVKAVFPSTGSEQGPVLVSGPGEYEVKEIFIQGIPSFIELPFMEAKIKKRTKSSSPHDSSLGVEEDSSSSSPFAYARVKERGQNTIYTIEAEGIRLCHLGDFGQKELTSEQIEKIGEVNILMVPIGGIYTISAKEAVRIMSQIEPSIIIPMHYQIPKLKLDTRATAKGGKEDLSSLNGLDKFLKIMGIKKIESLAKLSIKKKDISPEEAKIIILKP